jgi:hypothetical protein
MTIERLINELATLGQVIGHKAEVLTWNLREHENPNEPLGIRAVSGVSAGWDKLKQASVATIKIV